MGFDGLAQEPGWPEAARPAGESWRYAERHGLRW